jgi:hypothetical protein
LFFCRSDDIHIHKFKNANFVHSKFDRKQGDGELWKQTAAAAAADETGHSRTVIYSFSLALFFDYESDLQFAGSSCLRRVCQSRQYGSFALSTGGSSQRPIRRFRLDPKWRLLAQTARFVLFPFLSKAIRLHLHFSFANQSINRRSIGTDAIGDNSDTRYTLFGSGELHIRSVDKHDEQYSYRCEVTDLLLNRSTLSTNAAHLIVTGKQSIVRQSIDIDSPLLLLLLLIHF